MPEIINERKSLRKVTDNNRISFPKEMLLVHGINVGDNVKLIETNEGILITRYNKTCFICGCKKENDLKDINGFKICTDCIRNIKELEVE